MSNEATLFSAPAGDVVVFVFCDPGAIITVRTTPLCAKSRNPISPAAYRPIKSGAHREPTMRANSDGSRAPAQARSLFTFQEEIAKVFLV